MTFELRVNGQDLAPLLTGAPRIADDVESVCRTMDFDFQATPEVENYMGQIVEYFVNGKRWFIGILEVRRISETGSTSCKAYDPLYFLRRNPDDYYFKGTTATQRIGQILKNVGVRIGKLEPTGVVLKPVLYKGAESDKVAIDCLAKTKAAGGKNFWLRYNPDEDAEGADLFERKIPSEVWVFERGVNLISASYEESLEEMYNVVKLVNRETGKTVTKLDADSINAYGPRTHFEEAAADVAKIMGKTADDLLKLGTESKTAISLSGINPYIKMPMLYAGDVIYVEEERTGIAGAYHIKRIEQVPVSSRLVNITMDVQEAPTIPAIQFADAEKQLADEQAKKKKEAADAAKKKKTKTAGKKAKDTKKAKKGVQEKYSKETQAAIDAKKKEIKALQEKDKGAGK